MYIQQLSFNTLFMIEELCHLLARNNIMFFRGDSYVLFETNTFGHLIHTINIDEINGEYITILKQPNHSEKTYHYDDVNRVVTFVKDLQN